MDQQVPVRAGDVEFYVDLGRTGQPADPGGLQPIGEKRIIVDGEPLLFDGVRDTVQAIAGQLVQVWEAVAPDEARVEFSLAVSVKAGKLTGLLVDAGGDAALNVALVWRRGSSSGS